MTTNARLHAALGLPGPDLLALAAAARPTSDEDYGSDRHLDADARFWDAVHALVTADEAIELDVACEKGTCSECVDAGVALLRRGGYLPKSRGN